MSEEHVYKDGEIVWVKLGSSWWPGEVIADEKRLPEDVFQLKKRPYCVVKFFQEDAYEFAKNPKQVYPFQCSKKDEFIRKGLALHDAKKSFMEKFPQDVKHAESLTKPPDTQIITKIINDRGGGGAGVGGGVGLFKEMWETSPERRSMEFHESSHENQYEASSRRDSVTTILNITPNRNSISLTAPASLSGTPETAVSSVRKLSTSSSASVVTPNAGGASSQYRCNMCDFVTMRQNVLIMHRKSHSNSGPPSGVGSGITQSKSLNVSATNVSLEAPKKAPVAEEIVGSSEPLAPKIEAAVDDDVKDKKEDQSGGGESSSTPKTRKKASPIARVSNSKRSLRSPRNVVGKGSPTVESAAPNVNTESTTTTTKKVESVPPIKIETTTHDDDGGDAQKSSDVIPPTEKIRQRLLADWSDEEKEENRDNSAPKTLRKGRSPNNTLQIPAETVTIKRRRSPTIVPMKTLEGAGQTLVVASATHTHESAASSKARIRNIPKKDRLRDLGSSGGDAEQEQMMLLDDSSEKTEKVIDESPSSEEKAKSVSGGDGGDGDKIPTKATPPESITLPSTATLSCFDFQEEEDEHEMDVLQSIANYKKKYFSPDKEKSATPKTTMTTTTTTHATAEQRDKQLSAEIDNLLEQTTTPLQVLKEDAATASVKGLPIKERGKRIFKSRNRAPREDGGGGEALAATSEVTLTTTETTTTTTTKPTVEDTLDTKRTEIEIKEEEEEDAKLPTVKSPNERKTRSAEKRARGKADSREQITATSPVNGKSEQPENVKTEVTPAPPPTPPTSSETAVQTISEMVYVQRSSRRPYNHRIMRQLIEEDDASIPFIRHSPVELFSCDPSMDNGMNIVRGGGRRRSKTRTPNLSITSAHDEQPLNGGSGSGSGGSCGSSRNTVTAPLTPTDENSSLGLSDVGAEFGSPNSSLEDERLLTPVTDVDNERIEDNSLELEEDDDEIESPQHEALSGNELDDDDNESKDGTKRLKTPKKKLNAKKQQEEKQKSPHKDEKILEEANTTKSVGRRKSRTDTTPSPVKKDLPKRLTRGNLQQKGKESSPEEALRKVGLSPVNSSCGSPVNLEKRSTPTRSSSSRQSKLIKLTPDKEVATSRESPSPEKKSVESGIKTERKQPSPRSVGRVEKTTIDIPVLLEKNSKTRRSKTPNVVEGETGKEIESTEEVEKVEPQKSKEEVGATSTEGQNEDVESSDLNPEGTSGAVEERIEAPEIPQTNDISIEITNISSGTQSPLNTITTTFDPSTANELKSPPLQNVEKDDPSSLSSPQAVCKTPTTFADSLQGLSKKSSRWDSPHTPKRFTSSSPQNFEKTTSPRNGSPSSVEKTKKSSRFTESKIVSDVKYSRSDSPQSTNKKASRWDLQFAEKSEKVGEEDSSSGVAKNQLVVDTTESKVVSSAGKDSPDGKVQLSDDNIKAPTEKVTVDSTETSNIEEPTELPTEDIPRTVESDKNAEAELSIEDPSSTVESDKNAEAQLSIEDPSSTVESDKNAEGELSTEGTSSTVEPDKNSEADLSTEHPSSTMESDKNVTTESLTEDHANTVESETNVATESLTEDHANTVESETNVATESLTEDHANTVESETNTATDHKSTVESIINSAIESPIIGTTSTVESNKRTPNESSSVENSGTVESNDNTATSSLTPDNASTVESHLKAPSVDQISTVDSIVKEPTEAHSADDASTVESNKNTETEPQTVDNIRVESLSNDPIESPTLKNASAVEAANLQEPIGSPIIDNTSTRESNIKELTESFTVDSLSTLASNMTAPTLEKVRINVDVANPLSTQIANILAASGNGVNSQRNKSSKPNAASPSLKRKHSFEENGGASDGDAVVAHVQSLCPQVKITRKERIISPSSDLSQMAIALSKELISTPTSSFPSRSSVTTPTSFWQTDILQSLTSSPFLSGIESQSQSSVTSPNSSPAASTGGRKQVGNTVNLPSSLTVKQHQHKFTEALAALSDSPLGSGSNPMKRRSSQTISVSTNNVNGNRRLNSAPPLEFGTSSPAKIPKMTTTATDQSKFSPKKSQQEISSASKSWAQSQRETQKQRKLSSLIGSVEAGSEDSPLVCDVEQINSAAKITAVPIQPIPGYAETFLLCMLVNNTYKPINNIPHYLNAALNQLVPVPPEAYAGMLPELVVDQPPAPPSNDSESSALPSSSRNSSSSSSQHNRQMRSSGCDNNDSLLTSSVLGDSTMTSSDGSSSDEAAFKLMLQSSDLVLPSSPIDVDLDMADGSVDSASDNAIVLSLENQQIILDAATFEQLLSNPDANTQLVTDDGTEFVLTREVLAALKAQHDSQNVDLVSDDLIAGGGVGGVGGGGLSEAGSSGDLLSVDLPGSEFYGNDVLQIETSLGGAGAGAAGLQLLASDGSIIFQAPPLPQAHLTPPITAHTSETNAVLNQTPIMSILESPSTAAATAVSGRDAIGESIMTSSTEVMPTIESDSMSDIRRNLEDRLESIGVTTQTSTVLTSLNLPITITNPAIAPRVTMSQAASFGADLVQFQSLSVASVASPSAPSSVAHFFDDPTDEIN